VVKGGVLEFLLVKTIVVLHELELALVGILDALELRALIPGAISEHLDLLLVALLLEDCFLQLLLSLCLFVFAL
jgi:hypothetical protein